MRTRVVIILLILTPLFIAGFITSLVRRTALVRELETLQQEKAGVETQNTGLREVIQYFSLKANLEREARTNLNLARQGETLVIFVSPTPIGTPTAEPHRGVIERLFDWIRR